MGRGHGAARAAARRVTERCCLCLCHGPLTPYAVTQGVRERRFTHEARSVFRTEASVGLMRRSCRSHRGLSTHRARPRSLQLASSESSRRLQRSMGTTNASIVSSSAQTRHLSVSSSPCVAAVQARQAKRFECSMAGRGAGDAVRAGGIRWIWHVE